MKRRILWASPMALALAGCGGGNGEVVENYTPRAGDPLYVSTKIDGQEVASETYRYYALNESGRLVAEPKAGDENLPHIALRESSKVKPVSRAFKAAGFVTPQVTAPAVDQASMVAFAEELVAALRKHYPQASIRDVALQLGDFDRTLEDVYADYNNSGLGSLDAYVAFYETMDDFFTP